MANLFQPSLVRALDANGNPSSGARMWLYLTGTTTAATYYLDQSGEVPGVNPQVADSSGRFAAIYLDPEAVYRVVCTSADGTDTIFSADPVRGFDDGAIQTIASEAVDAQAATAANTALARQYAVADTDDPIEGAEDDADRGARYEANRAATAATTALTASGAAQGYSSDAQGFRDEAEVFAQNAADGAEIYADTTAGIAGTTNGQWFKTANADGTSLYKNVAGVATLVNVTPSQGSFDDAVADLETTYRIVEDELAEGRMVDPDGFAGLFVDEDGAHAPNIDTLESQMSDDVLPVVGNFAVEGTPIDTALVDSNGYAGFVADASDLLNPGYVDTRTRARIGYRIAGDQGRLTNEQWRILASVNHCIVDSQSNGIGSYATPNIAPYPTMDFAIQFEGGIRALDYTAYGATARDSFIALRETDTTPSSTALGQTVCSSAAAQLRYQVREHFDIDIADLDAKFLFTAPDQGSQKISDLMNPAGPNWPRMTADIDAALTLTLAAGQTLLPACVFWLQGEASMEDGTEGTESGYISSILARKAQIEGYYATTLGHSVDIPFILYQVATHTTHNKAPIVAMAQKKLAEEQAGFSMPFITYCCDFSSGEHYTAQWQNIGGCFMGQDLFERKFMLYEPRPLSTATPLWQDSAVIIPFRDAVGDVVFDTELVTDPGNYGLELVDSGGLPLAIASTQIKLGRALEVVATGSIPSGAVLRYAWGTPGSNTFGRTGGARGCIRDSRGRGYDAVVGRAAGNFPLDKYLPITSWTKP